MKTEEEMRARFKELDDSFGSWTDVELVEYMFLQDALS